MPEITQTDRLIAVDTPLGADVLLLRSFTGTESMSRIFRFRLDMLSTNFSVDFDQIVGKNVTVRIRLEDDSERFINGFVSRFAQLPVEGHLSRYEAEIVPWLWFLTRTADCKIFQEKSVPDIIAEVFDEFGFSDYELQLEGTYEPRTYSVQYRETAANFVMRLMEEEGIFFHFRHEEGKHVMVIGDSSSVHQPCPSQSEMRYEHTVGSGPEREEDVIFDWRYEHELRTGKYALNDYNFETPSTSLLSNVESTIDQGGNKKYEIYDYPGEYLERGRGDTLVRTRIEEEETPHEVVTGGGNCRSMALGHKFTLSEHDRRDQNREYMLTSITHSAHSGTFIGGTQGEGASYANTFTCIPSSVLFRPLRMTPKPVVEGVQTAVVVGPSGEEIYVDRYGRIKVQFHWDRIGRKDESSSCWIRVSQPWAGKNWGGVFLPRLGQEVMVDFIEGDPDRPIITGRVYNAEQMPPYDLPGNQTQSGFKSRSSKGGGSANYNEIRFEDKKGSEMITVHAEKNMETEVENDDRQHVMHDRTINVDRNHTETITKDYSLTIERGDRTIDVEMGNESISLGMGNRDIKLDLGKQTNQAMQSIELKVGQSSVKVDQMGVTIKGMMVKIDARILAEVKGTMTKVEGSALVAVKGGVIMIG